MADLKVILKLYQHYQKFRYSTEKRSGKKNHETPMMKVWIPLPDQSEGFEGRVKILIVCVSAHSPTNVLHPNLLVGKYCDRYFKLDDIPMDKRKIKGDYLTYSVPYLYIERTKQHDKLTAVKKTMNLIPEIYHKEFNVSDNLSEKIYKNMRTDVVRLKVCVELHGKVLEPAFSPIITHHDGGEKVSLNIIKMSESTFQPDNPNVTIDIFTEENGPDIKPDEFDVHVETPSWKSQSVIIKQDEILYKRIIMYKVPTCGDLKIEHGDVNGNLILTCLINGLSCSRSIIYAMSKIERKRKQLKEQPEPTHIKRLCVEPTRGVQTGPIVTDTQFGNSNLLANAMERAGIPSLPEYQSSQADPLIMLTNNSGSSFHSDVQQPMETHGVQQPMETYGVQQHVKRFNVQQPMETHGVQQPMETSITFSSKSNPPAGDPNTDVEASSSSTPNWSTLHDVCEKRISPSFSPSFSDKSSENDLRSISPGLMNLDSVDLVKYLSDCGEKIFSDSI